MSTIQWTGICGAGHADMIATCIKAVRREGGDAVDYVRSGNTLILGTRDDDTGEITILDCVIVRRGTVPQ